MFSKIRDTKLLAGIPALELVVCGRMGNMDLLKLIWNNFPILISLIGGFTGCFALAISWKSFRKERSQLEVDVKLHRNRDTPDQPLKWCFEVILRNRGRRPCYIDRIGLELPAKSIKYGDVEMTPVGPVIYSLYKGQKKGPVKLEESQMKSVAIKDFPEALLMAAASFGNGIGTILVVDSLGRDIHHSFRLPPKEFIKLPQKEEHQPN